LRRSEKPIGIIIKIIAKRIVIIGIRVLGIIVMVRIPETVLSKSVMIVKVIAHCKNITRIIGFRSSSTGVEDFCIKLLSFFSGSSNLCITTHINENM